jgi:lauroyl/myristoyl acyltransferase
MPIFAILAGGWLKSVVLPFLTGLPRWVWYVIFAGIALMLYTAHVRKEANAKKEVEFVQRQEAEKKRQATVIDKAVEAASQRAEQAEAQLLSREKDYEDVANELEKLRKAQAAKGQTATVCIPAAIADRVRRNAESGRPR